MVTGDRNHSNKSNIQQLFEDILSKKYPSEKYAFIHGGCRGADLLSASTASEYNYKVCQFSADWNKYGKGAGPIRNKEMLSMLPKVVIIFHNDLSQSKGTKDCVKQMLKLIKDNRSFKPTIYLNGIKISIKMLLTELG